MKRMVEGFMRMGKKGFWENREGPSRKIGEGGSGRIGKGVRRE